MGDVMIDRPGRRKRARVSVPTVLALVALLMIPMPARGQIILPQEQCVFGEGFPTACATLLSIDFTGNTVTLVIANTSNVTDNPNGYLSSLFLEFMGSVPQANSAFVDYGGGVTEAWNIGANQPVQGLPGGFATTWSLKVFDPTTGVMDLRLAPGDQVTITIQFASSVAALSFPDCGADCLGRGWSAQMQALPGDPEGSGYTSIPEPSTVFLLATGLLAIGGVGLFRRRRLATQRENR